jgi:hypothetical protein
VSDRHPTTSDADVPDPQIGEALHTALDPGDDRAFAASVMARIDARAEGAGFWNLLGRWARPGIPVAAALALIVLFVLGRPGAEPTLDEALVGGDGEGAAAFLAHGQPPDAGILVPVSAAP